MSRVRTAMGWTTALTATPCFAVAAVLAYRAASTGDAAHRVARAWARLLLTAAGARVTVAGYPPTAADGPVVLMSNHSSSLDIPVLLAILDPSLRAGFLAKHSLFGVPFLGGAMRALGCIPVHRENLRAAGGMLAGAVEILRSGRSMVAFPEGTWSLGEELLPFHRGAFLLAVRARVPIVPVGLEGVRRVLPASGRRVRPGPVAVRFGGAVPSQRCTASELPDLICEVRAAIERLRRSP